MNKSQVVTGLILPSGELRVDGSVDLAPGRVRVVVTELPFQADEDNPWGRLEQTWNEQRARHFLSAEAAAQDGSKSPPDQRMIDFTVAAFKETGTVSIILTGSAQ